MSLEIDKCKSKNAASLSEVLALLILELWVVYLTYHIVKININA